jgi:hypothetical protein
VPGIHADIRARSAGASDLIVAENITLSNGSVAPPPTPQAPPITRLTNLADLYSQRRSWPRSGPDDEERRRPSITVLLAA